MSPLLNAYFYSINMFVFLYPLSGKVAGGLEVLGTENAANHIVQFIVNNHCCSI